MRTLFLLACDFLLREFHVYFAVGASSPLVYAPVTCKSMYHPIALAFYKLGHYKSVSCDNSEVNDNKYTFISHAKSALQPHLNM